MTTGPKYPDISIQLVGLDGNAFSILGRCQLAMKAAGLDAAMRQQFQTEAMGGSYDHLLHTVMLWFDVDGDAPDGAE